MTIIGVAFVVTLSVAVAVAWSAFKPYRVVNIEMREAAERLDMAVSDRNAIATALDLIRTGEPSDFGRCAILAGIDALNVNASHQPVTAAAISNSSPALARLVAAAAIVAAAFLLPAQRWIDTASTASTANLIAVNVNPATTTDHAAQKRDEPSRSRYEAFNVAPAPRQLMPPSATPSTSTPANRSNGGLGSAPAAANSASAGATSADPASTTSPPTRSLAADLNKLATRSDTGSPMAPPSQKSMSLAGPAGQLSSASSLQSSSPNGADGSAKPSGAEPAAKANEEAAETTARSSGFRAPVADAAVDDGGDSDADKPGNGKPSKASHSKGGNAPSGEPSGGNGQSGGENPPKKSRGVAPLMLGSRLPDVVQGRQLPGPDQRTDLDVPPQAMPESPADPSPASSRRGDESSIASFRVPAEWRARVNQYFEQLHADAVVTH